MTAFVLMTALPPTKGHLRLIQFASRLDRAVVIVSTQPGEPYANERFESIRKAAPVGTMVYHLHRTIEQNPEAPGFWKMWDDILVSYGKRKGDYIVASEDYGNRLAAECDMVFMPYDIDREVMYTKASNIRDNPRNYFSWILPEFQRNIVQRVTVFGAESTGKTTLSRKLAVARNGHWIPEWARPYLEHVKNEITDETMTAIWKGQKALQQSMNFAQDKPYIFQDTDLFSTVGYWDFWTDDTPEGLNIDAIANKSDLYLITLSDIPFEPDPLRYGGDRRESEDEYWIDLCRRYGLNYRIIDAGSPGARLDQAVAFLDEHYKEAVQLSYEREFNE